MVTHFFRLVENLEFRQIWEQSAKKYSGKRDNIWADFVYPKMFLSPMAIFLCFLLLLAQTNLKMHRLYLFLNSDAIL